MHFTDAALAHAMSHLVLDQCTTVLYKRALSAARIEVLVLLSRVSTTCPSKHRASLCKYSCPLIAEFPCVVVKWTKPVWDSKGLSDPHIGKSAIDISSLVPLGIPTGAVEKVVWILAAAAALVLVPDQVLKFERHGQIMIRFLIDQLSFRFEMTLASDLCRAVKHKGQRGNLDACSGSCSPGCNSLFKMPTSSCSASLPVCHFFR